MLYVNILGGQKWRPTCTGSEVCMYVNVDVSFFYFLINMNLITSAASRLYVALLYICLHQVSGYNCFKLTEMHLYRTGR